MSNGKSCGVSKHLWILHAASAMKHLAGASGAAATNTLESFNCSTRAIEVILRVFWNASGAGRGVLIKRVHDSKWQESGIFFLEHTLSQTVLRCPRDPLLGNL